MTSLGQLPSTLAESLVALVKLGDLGLVVRQLMAQFVNRLRSTGPNRDERRALVQRSNWYNVRLLLDLSREKSDTSSHFVDTTDLSNERALEWVDTGVELEHVIRH